MDNYRKIYKRRWIKLRREKNRKKLKKEYYRKFISSSDSEPEVVPFAVSCPKSLDAPSCSSRFSQLICDKSTSIADTNLTIISHENAQVVQDHEESSRPFVESDENSSEKSFNLGGDACFKEKMIQWVNQFEVKHAAVDDLLKLLQNYGHSYLPSSCRTLLATPKTVNLEQRSSMEYFYFSLQTQLFNHLSEFSKFYERFPDILNISLNIDGLPLFKSSNKCLWPILCSINNLQPSCVFPIALCYGCSKPANLDFLKDTVEDIKALFQNKLVWKSQKIYIKLQSIICDAPARSMVKSTKSFNGYYGCDFCTQKGLWLGRITYQECVKFEMRSDQSFRDQINKEHHIGISPFLELPVNMIQQFPLDYMHQTCLGVMKKLLLTWMRGNKKVRLSFIQIEEISSRLINLRQFVPRCFSRLPRSLREVDRWKATEFRQFLLYTGKLVLKKILPGDLYNHFLLLNVALCILVSKSLCTLHLELASTLLQKFVVESADLYGKEFLVYNVHCLLHLTYTVQNFGSLDNCSAFKFENYMQTLKRKVRSGKKPLSQIVNRLHENSVVIKNKADAALIHTKPPDNAYVNNSGLLRFTCLQVVEKHNESQHLCRVFENVKCIFTLPCNSDKVGMYKGHLHNSSIKLIDNSYLTTKAMCIQQQNSAIFLSVLHDIV